MIKPLRDAPDGADPLLLEAARLLCAVPPLTPSPLRKERVRAALSRQRPKAAWQRAPLLGALRPAVAFLLLLVLMAAASAMIGRRLLRHQSAPAPPAPPAPIVRAPMAPSIPAPPAGLWRPAPPPAAPPPAVPPPKHARPARLAAPRPEVPAAAPDNPEAALVLAAVKALRRDKDPERAGVLLDDYLRLYPRGALAEEALALAIEAAAARGDERAVELANEYLSRFPGGRFREVARRARQPQD